FIILHVEKWRKLVFCSNIVIAPAVKGFNFVHSIYKIKQIAVIKLMHLIIYQAKCYLICSFLYFLLNYKEEKLFLSDQFLCRILPKKTSCLHLPMLLF